MIRAALAALLCWAALPAAAQVLSHRLDSLSIDGQRASDAQLVQGELHALGTWGWLRRR